MAGRLGRGSSGSAGNDWQDWPEATWAPPASQQSEEELYKLYGPPGKAIVQCPTCERAFGQECRPGQYTTQVKESICYQLHGHCSDTSKKCKQAPLPMTKLWELPVWLMLYKGPNDTAERFLKAPPREMPENYYVAEAREAEEGRTSAGSRRLFLKSNAEWEPPPEWSGRRESRSRSGRRRLSDRAHCSLSRELRQAPGRRRHHS